MTTLRGHGISVLLPSGWEGHLGRRAEAVAAAVTAGTAAAASAVTEVVLPVAHLASVALPADRGDFGSGAVDGLGPDDVFVALIEYGPECVGTATFPATGLPRRAGAANFNRRSLQRTIDGQSGWQHFFSEGDRAFCLYVVLGRDHDVTPLLRTVDEVLAAVTIEAR